MAKTSEDKKPLDETVENNVTELHAASTPTDTELDADEQEFNALRRDLPGVKGVSAVGIVTISVGEVPTPKNEFFRTHREFRPIVPIVNVEVGMEHQYFVVTPAMVEPLNSIGITVSDYTLYLTVTPRGAFRIIPVRGANSEGVQNEYDRTREIGLVQAIDEWKRLYVDNENRCYKVFPAPAGRYADPQWPDLKPAKIFKLGFRDKGWLIDSTEHTLFLKWVARDSE
jgi:hypothetical protein